MKLGRIALGCILASCCALHEGAWAHAWPQVITEFGGGITASAGLLRIAAGPDGNLWFTENNRDRIGRITPLGVVTEFSAGITAGASIGDISGGPDANLWFTEGQGNRIGRITPLGVVTEFSAGIAAGAGIGSIAAGPDGNMWFAEFFGNRIGRITPLGVVTEFSAGISVNAGVGGITAGPDGNLWFTEYYADRIGRITTGGVVTEFSTGITPGAGITGIAAGPDGNLWFVESNGNRVGRITTTGIVTEFSIGITASAHPRDIAAGPDGNVWFTEAGAIGKVTTAGVITEFSSAPIIDPEGIAVGPDGNMWFADFFGNFIGWIAVPPNFVVINTNDSGPGSLRASVAAALAAGPYSTVDFDPAVTGTILLTSGQIPITGPVNLVGPGAGALTIDANGSSRVISIYEDVADVCATPGSDFPVSISGLTMTHGVFVPSTYEGGGAIYAEKSLTLNDVVISNSQAKVGGGMEFATRYEGQALSIVDSRFVDNVAVIDAVGGGLDVDERCFGVAPRTIPASISITASVFSGNHTKTCDVLCGYGAGGGISVYSDDASVTITDSRIVGNVVEVPADPVALLYGGGIDLHGSGSVRIERSEISGNSGSYVGGGLSVVSGSTQLLITTIINSTISGNSTRGVGGAGIYAEGGVALLVQNSTITDNAPLPGTPGAMLLSSLPDSATVILDSSIVAKSQGEGTEIDSDGGAASPFTVYASQSLVGPVSANVVVSGTANLVGIDPLLGPLSFNGGPTQTHPLLPGSPAINAGRNPLSLATDQRGAGFPRVVGGVADMGAFESPVVAALPVLQSAKSRRVHGTAGTFDLSLTLTATGTVNHAPAIEPRQGPNQTVVFTFDKPITSATATVNEGTATVGTLTFSGNDVVVPFTGVNNQQYVTVTLTSVASSDVGTGGNGEARIGFLLGDLNGTRAVSVADLGLVNAQLAQPVTAANFLKDVNVSGAISVADKGITNANLTKALPAP